MNLNMQTPQKQRGWVQFLPMIGSAIEGLGGIFGGKAKSDAYAQANKDIKNMPGMQGPVGLSGNFGSAGADGFQMNQGMLGLQNMMGLSSMGLLGGGLYNDPGLQQALGMNNIGGALQQSDAALQQQMGSNALGNMGGFFNAAQGLGAGLAGQLAGGPQDYFGGAGGGLLQQGMQNIGDFGGTMSAELAAMRNAAQPAMDRQFNKLQGRLHAMGMLGSTGGGQQMEGLLNAQNQQDLDFQTQAFNRAIQRSQLGGQQVGLGQQLTQANLGQYNQNLSNFGALGTLASGLESTQFGQNLQALTQNQSAGMNRLNQAMGLLGGAGDLFSQQYGLGMQGAGGMLDFGQFGLDAAALPYQLQAQLLGASGAHSSALSNMAKGAGSAKAGFLGGLASGVGKVFKMFSDERLKDNLRWVGTDGRGNNWYEWDWNSQAKLVGAHKQPAWGVIAQEVQKYHPEAVTEGPGGFLQVDYEVLYNG